MVRTRVLLVFYWLTSDACLCSLLVTAKVISVRPASLLAILHTLPGLRQDAALADDLDEDMVQKTADNQTALNLTEEDKVLLKSDDFDPDNLNGVQTNPRGQWTMLRWVCERADADREGVGKGSQYITCAMNLLDAGADPNIPSGDTNQVPLDFACSSGNIALVQRMIEARANVNHASTLAMTPLMAAARASDRGFTDVPGITQKLFEAKADLGAEDKDGQTALHYAAVAAKKETVRMLMYLGANTGALDNEGRTPIELVMKKLEELDTEESGRDIKSELEEVEQLLDQR